MNNLIIATQAEIIKLRRSWIFAITVGLFIFIPLMMGLLMYVAQHPEMADKLGLIGAKAQFFKENSWVGFFEILNQIIAVMGIIGFGFVTSWVFGREYLEHTLTDILALPVSRTSIVLAKFLIVLIWCTALSIILFGSGIIIGQIISIPGWSVALFAQFTRQFLLTSFYTILLSTVIGFVASFTRGIIAPLGFVLLMVVLAQFVAIVGWGPYFPWAIPGVFTVSQGVEGMHLVPASYFILVLTSIAGLLGTVYWWKFADQ